MLENWLVWGALGNLHNWWPEVLYVNKKEMRIFPYIHSREHKFTGKTTLLSDFLVLIIFNEKKKPI